MGVPFSSLNGRSLLVLGRRAGSPYIYLFLREIHFPRRPITPSPPPTLCPSKARSSFLSWTEDYLGTS